MKLYDKKNNRLIFSEQIADDRFWDKHWGNSDLKKILSSKKQDMFVSRFTKKYIKPDLSKKILEGGCGKGQYVRYLSNAGYDAYGIDYAENTIKKINEVAPDLKIYLGNIKKINFANNFFDGYWSLGVIEHFFDGYVDITKEMHRVIRPGGFLFVTFPYMSPLRKIKARFNKYHEFKQESFNKENFYQFSLDHNKVIADLESIGFTLKKTSPFDGIKGLKDEILFLKPTLQKIYDSKNIVVAFIRIIISILFSRFSGHSILLIFKKNA